MGNRYRAGRVRLLRLRGRMDVREQSVRRLRPREEEVNVGEGEGYVCHRPGSYECDI